MIRLSLLSLFLTATCLYAFKDWFRSLCVLVVLMAIIEHPDMPKTMLGIQGLNPWNITLLFVVMGWLSANQKERNAFDVPAKITFLLFGYFFVICISFLRLTLSSESYQDFLDLTGSDTASFLSLFSEFIINCLKWIVPGFLFYHGCRTKERLLWGSCALLLIYILLAVQVIRWMPLGGLASGGDFQERSLKILSNEIGYHRVNLAMLLAGGFWALFAFRDLVPNKKYHKYLYLLLGIVFLGLALTAGRTGYVTWAAIGLVLISMRWRRLLLLAPIPVVLVAIFIPAVTERLTSGFGGKNIDTNATLDAATDVQDNLPHLYTITAGRTTAWPLVIDEIVKAPFVGHGREAMITTGVATHLLISYGETFSHPHNAYLQWVFDNGLLGFLPVFFFYFLMFKYSLGLFREKGNQIASGIGGICLSLLLALLIAALGSQSFYPREGAVGMWCAFGLMLRVYVDRSSWAQNEVEYQKNSEGEVQRVASSPPALWTKARASYEV